MSQGRGSTAEAWLRAKDRNPGIETVQLQGRWPRLCRPPSSLGEQMCYEIVETAGCMQNLVDVSIHSTPKLEEARQRNKSWGVLKLSK